MLSIVLAMLVAAVAATDWWAVRHSAAPVEVIAKPMVMVSLIGLALVVDAEPGGARWLMVAGLGFGLIGDVLLLPRFDRFLPGLGAFLVGHCFYIAAFVSMDLSGGGLVGGIAAAGLVLVYMGVPIVRAVRGTGYGLPVMLYMGVIAAMVVTGTATQRWPIAVGGVLFAFSDGLLGLDRFVSPAPNRRVVVHMLYHLGQVGFVLGLGWTS